MEIRCSITSQGKKYLISLFLILSLIMVSSKKSIGAQSALSELRINIGVRALGMGKAYVAVADDYSAPFWNPAGVGRLSLLEGGGGTMDKFGLDLNYTFLGGGGSYPVTQIPLINGIAAGGGYVKWSTQVRGKTLSEEIFTGTLGLKLTSKGYIGGNMKKYHVFWPKSGSDGEDLTANGMGYDLGVLFGPFKGLWFGASGFDLTDTDIDWSNNSGNYPVRHRYQFGTAYAPKNFDFMLSGQYVQDPAGGNELRAGGEYKLSFSYVKFSLRGGLVNPLEGDAYFTAGAGLEISQTLQADIAWIQNKVLEASNTSDTIVLGAEFSF